MTLGDYIFPFIMIAVGIICFVLLFSLAQVDPKKYETVDVVCYEGYSYLYKLGPTPLTLKGIKDEGNC